MSRPRKDRQRRIAAWTAALALLGLSAAARGLEPPWTSPRRYRLLLEVDPRGVSRSFSPASVDLDLAGALRERSVAGRFDEHTIEVVAHDAAGAPAVFDASRPGYERYLLPWRLEKYYGIERVTLHFVVPDESRTLYTVYFDTAESGQARPERYPGPVGDGDFFRQGFGRRETGATHFDAFADLDGDGDLDLFRGGVEPFIDCHENLGDNRLVGRGRLTSGGELLTLPQNSRNGRSWVLPHFHDLDRDGDLDFFPSFMDGPYARRLAFFENTTAPGGLLTFVDRGVLKTASGTPLAGGEQTGGWFPSVTFVEDFDGDGDRRIDLLVGSNNHCYLYRSLGRGDAAGGWRWAEAVALEAGGEEIELFNPCFDVADIDGDGDRDLFAAPQAGQILFFENVDATPARTRPVFARGVVVAHDDVTTQPSTHPRVTVADFTGDGLLDLVVDRAWELADLRRLGDARDFGALIENVGTARAPEWRRRDAHGGAPYSEEFQICDALRQNVVRAADWNGDGKTDLLAGDCDGFVWYFENRTGDRRPLFAAGNRLRAGGEVLSRAASGGHARPDVCDWNGDGRQDLVVADGAGRVTVYLGEEADGAPALGPGRPVRALDARGELAPIDRGTRSHVMVCDWNADGRQDLVFSDQENPGFYVFENRGTDAEPLLGAPRRIEVTPYVRPSPGSFVDWDGDSKMDFIGCEFEHSIRLYRNVGSGRPGDEPEFTDADGVDLVRPPSIMMISGADAVDWNGDGDLDILTGQGHGGSGIRFYEHDYIEDTRNGTRPLVRVERFERAAPSFLDVVRRYADAMIEHGRDVYGPEKSGLLLSALDRRTLAPLKVRPAPPAGIRRGDRAGLPWRRLAGANPHLDENLLRVLYTLGEITGEARYRRLADQQIEWFFENTQSPVTGLLPWGEHLSWDVMLDRPVSSGTDLTHEFARPWVLWDRSFELAPEASRKFALGLWKHQIADQQTGAFDRHAPYDRHGPRDGRDFPRHAGFYIHTWAHAYRHTEDRTFLGAIEALLARFERQRSGANGKQVATLGPLDVETAASLVPEPLASRLREFARVEDRLVLEDLRRQHGGPDGTWAFRPTWQAGYASGVTAGWAMFGIARYRQTETPAFRDLVIAVADAYRDALPDEDVDVWPMSFAHVISAQVASYRFTKRPVYLAEACRFARRAVDTYWQDSPLPRASFKTDHYETITGADSLALALLEVHAARSGLEIDVPPNTIDR